MTGFIRENKYSLIPLIRGLRWNIWILINRVSSFWLNQCFNPRIILVIAGLGGYLSVNWSHIQRFPSWEPPSVTKRTASLKGEMDQMAKDQPHPSQLTEVQIQFCLIRRTKHLAKKLAEGQPLLWNDCWYLQATPESEVRPVLDVFGGVQMKGFFELHILYNLQGERFVLVSK